MFERSIRFLSSLLALAAAGMAYADFTVSKSLSIKPPKIPQPYMWNWTWGNSGTNVAKEKDVTDTKTKDGAATVANPAQGAKDSLEAIVGGTSAKTQYSIPKLAATATGFDATITIDGKTALGPKANTPSATITKAESKLSTSAGIRVWDAVTKKFVIQAAVAAGSISTSDTQVPNSIADPVVARLIDHTTGDVYEKTLFEWELSFGGGGGNAATVDEFGAHIVADSAVFEVSMPGEWTVASGWARVVVEGGVVVESQGGGIYAGLLPSVGSTGPLDLAMTGAELEFSDGLMSSLDGHDVELQTEIGVGGNDAKAAAVPEPASMVALAAGCLGARRRRSRGPGRV